MCSASKKIFLTGSGGFIGGNLKLYLQGKYNLLTPRSYELNLCDSEAVKKYFDDNDIDFVIHCGSVGGYRGQNDKDTTVEDNLAMVENILNYKKNEARVILFGSGAMYDRKRDLQKVREDEIGQHVPSELYGKSKMLIAQKVKDRQDVICFNIFGCYGKGEKSTRFPSYAISQNLKHENIEINQDVMFDYLYIDDLVKIIYYFIENKQKKYNIMNLTPKESITLSKIAKTVNEISGYESKIVINNPVMNYEYTGDNSRLIEEMGSFVFTPYLQGLTVCYNQYSYKWRNSDGM